MSGIVSRKLDMTGYSISAFREEWRPSYDVFITNNFGENAYQKTRAYIDWLYFANPYNRGYSDFKVILADGRDVIGCYHKLRFQFCDRNSSMIDAASIHNLMVDKDHRNGIGFLLIRDFLKSEKCFLIPGVVGELSNTYRKLGSASLCSYWGIKPLIPSISQFGARLRGVQVTPELVQAKMRSLNVGDVCFSTGYEDALAGLIDRRSDGFSVSEEFLRWRLFLPNRLSTITTWSISKKSAILFAAGSRKGVPAGRVFFTSFANVEDGALVTRRALQLMKKLGCAVALFTSSDPLFPEVAYRLGVSQKKISPDTYWFSKTVNFDAAIPWTLVSDLGFEENFAGI